MRESHLRDVLAIETEAYSSPWSYEMFRQEVEDNMISRAYVALRAGAVVGYAIAWFMRDEAHIINIAVAEKQRQQGLGRHLMCHLMERARAETKVIITLEVRPSNNPARQLYTALHFRPLGIRKSYYEDSREDAMVMVLDLGLCS